MADQRPVSIIDGDLIQTPVVDTLTHEFIRTQGERNTVIDKAISDTLVQEYNYVRQTVAGITSTLFASPTTGDSLKVENASSGKTFIDGNGNNINGLSSQTLRKEDIADLVFNGVEWRA